MYTRIKNKEAKIAVIGLGYVGLPLAVEFAKKYDVIGFDINSNKINKYIEGFDVTDEVGNEAVQNSTCTFTSDEELLKECEFFVVAVPTPINQDKTPNLTPVISATELVARVMPKGAIVVYESTVYPGTTEEICLPILEKMTGYKYNEEFFIGYSPERINPGDKINTLTTIVKVVSGSTDEVLKDVSKIYGSIITAGVHEAESIKVAEASKIIENSQRDVNIAFMNELSMVFNMMEINTKAVLEAAGTKWNFLKFTPGLVGGHCIGVDPYYFTYKAEQLGYHSQIISAGRKINDEMGRYVASNIIKKLISADKKVRGARVGIFGITFKENCADIRNTKITDIINELAEYEVETIICDPVADKTDVMCEYNIELTELSEVNNLDAVVVAVSHDVLKETLTIEFLESISSGVLVLIDVKSIFNAKQMRTGKYFSL